MPRHPTKANTWLKPLTEQDQREIKAVIASQPKGQALACWNDDGELRLIFPVLQEVTETQSNLIAE